AFFGSSAIALAEDNIQTGSATNFVLIDYGLNLSADADIKDTMTLGTGGDEANESELLFSGEAVDDTSGFIGIGIGHRYNNNIAAVLRYETGETEAGTMGALIAEGSPITSVDVASIDLDITTIMLEGVYFIPYSERIELWGLVGIGQSEVETNKVSATIDGTAVIAVCGDSEDNTSTRLGVGATYYMNQTQGFYAGLTMSQYGDASFKAEDDGSCSNQADTASIEDIEATDFRIGYFRSF
ncbi:MAG: outer membrane beta-barrel protein, partial [Alphaproteobacteria bacterium]|nr:outer membrane beta-barrel protein [Alphaproteobacteria bacterium]